jgi:hypothetical protein
VDLVVPLPLDVVINYSCLKIQCSMLPGDLIFNSIICKFYNIYFNIFYCVPLFWSSLPIVHVRWIFQCFFVIMFSLQIIVANSVVSTLQIEGVSDGRHWHETNTCDYIQLINFLKLSPVSMPCSLFVSLLHRCPKNFIVSY